MDKEMWKKEWDQRIRAVDFYRRYKKELEVMEQLGENFQTLWVLLQKRVDKEPENP